MATKRKTWVGRVHLGGGRYHWVGRFPTRAERNEAVARAKVERPWDATASADEWTVDQWAARFLARMESGDLRTRGDRRYKDSSIDTARGQLKALRAEFGGRGLNSITRVEAEDWAARVRPSAIPIAIQLMGAAYRAELIDRNRFEGLARPTEGRKNERPPSEGDMLLLLDGCSALGDDYAPVMRAMLTFAAFTLARPGELFALQWSDIDLDAGECGRVRIERRFYRGRTDLPKSNKARTITLAPPAREALDSLPNMEGYYPAGLVFRNKTGGQLTEPTLTAYWKEVRARARVDLDFYSSSKHYGCWYMKVVLGLPDAVIASQAGWAERSVTRMVETYAHAVDDRRLDEIDAAFKTHSQTQTDEIPHQAGT